MTRFCKRGECDFPQLAKLLLKLLKCSVTTLFLSALIDVTALLPLSQHAHSETVEPLQQGCKFPTRQYETRQSQYLEDNRIGEMVPLYRWGSLTGANMIIEGLNKIGLKYNRLSFDLIEPWDRNLPIDLITSTYEITPAQMYLVEGLLEHKIDVCYILEFWTRKMIEDYERAPDGYSRFRNEEEVNRYTDYVRFIVSSLRGRVKYYEILNEPDVTLFWNWVRLPDYINLIRKTVPVIREIDPNAKIVVGSVSNLAFKEPQKYLFGIARSSVVSMVDLVSFHPFFGASPAIDLYYDYYYGYADLVRELRQVLQFNGFTGELMATEMVWRTSMNYKLDEPWVYSETVAAKYYARGVITNLGLDVIAGVGGENVAQIPTLVEVGQNLCTVMAGHQPIDMRVKIAASYDGPIAYCAFLCPDGNRMIAIWTDGVAKDEDPGVATTITIPSLAAARVTGIDILHGVQQDLEFEAKQEALVIQNILVKDYPVLIWLNGVTTGPDYTETPGDGFHRLWNLSGAKPGPQTESDRDGDGVPDEEDWCPDWPGSKKMNGC